MMAWLVLAIIWAIYVPLAWGLGKSKTSRDTILRRAFLVLWGVLWALFTLENGVHPSPIYLTLGGFGLAMMGVVVFFWWGFMLLGLSRFLLSFFVKQERVQS